MILFEFLESVRPMGIFSTGELELLYPDLDSRRLYEWHIRKYIIKLRNGWYCLPDFLEEPYSTWMIANKVHQPSYISLESALSYHGIIPEGVYMTTSVTTNRTLRLSMAGSEYTFSKLKNEFFLGYEIIGSGKDSRKIKVAEPEKAIIDFFYFHPEYNSEDEILQLRFNEPALRDHFEAEKLLHYLSIFRNKMLEKRITTMLKITGYA